MIGPPGLKGFVEAMGAIVKRRYPELIVREVEDIIHGGTVALHEQLVMEVTPIRSINVSRLYLSIYLCMLFYITISILESRHSIMI